MYSFKNHLFVKMWRLVSALCSLSLITLISKMLPLIYFLFIQHESLGVGCIYEKEWSGQCH